MAQSTLRGLEIIAFLAERGDPASVQQIAEGTRMSRATAYRVVEDLTSAGWLCAGESSARFALTLKVAQLGISALRQHRVRDILLPSAIDLARVTGRMVTVAFYDHGEVVFTDNVEVVGERVMPMVRGLRAPAVCTGSGKILLALQDPDEIERVVTRGVPQLGTNTKTDPAAIRADIHLTRERGYGLAHDEFGPRSGGLAVAVFDHAGKPVAALGLHCEEAPSDALTEQLLPPAKMIAARASVELGYRMVSRTAV